MVLNLYFESIITSIYAFVEQFAGTLKRLYSNAR